MRTFEVKNPHNLATILKQFPTAKVTSLISGLHEDFWRIEIPDDQDNKGNVLPLAQIVINVVPCPGTPHDNETFDKALQAWESYSWENSLFTLIYNSMKSNDSLKDFTIDIHVPE